MYWLRELWGELRQQRVRALLSLLSITWGTLSILLLLAFSVGFEELFAERQRGLGDSIAIAFPQRTTLPHAGFPVGRRLVVERDDVQALAAGVPGLAAISAEITTRERVTLGERALRITLSGVEPVYQQLRSIAAAPGGRFVDRIDLAEGRRVIFLGDGIARLLFAAEPAVGRTLVLRGAPFLVVGVLAPKLQDSDYNGRDESRAFVPITTFTQVFGQRQVSNFVFRARDPERQAECTAAVTAALAARLRFDPADRQALSVWDTTEQQRMLGYIFLGFHLMLGISGMFTMLVGGVGIANLMFLLVRRRTAEIGLKLAVGARPAQIRREVLNSALILVGAGGVLGALLAGIAVGLVTATPLPAEVGTPRVPPLLGLGATLLLLGTGLAAGWFPARRAAQLDPVAALRGA